ncbi:hypothetical protein L195_g000939 [Trifolium pratense]|uniref:N-acetyltransferase domain-containing protein n=1 Tax=Trifolium pratense TaxID=57577 RepID=A0A2K3NNA9_TRIPR|nr:hypothetical protein L195_g000939 [Trifolium pratense]
MSLKIGAENWPKSSSQKDEEPLIVIREYDEEKHKVEVEKLERLCEVGQRGKPSLVTDLLGDPICRIRHFQLHVMLVAEYGKEGEIVGVIRGCVKTVARGNSAYVKLAYVLGLRVSPKHRRFGIGTKLVEHLEEWCKQKGAKTLTMLVQPVHAHYKPISTSIAVLRLPPRLARLTPFGIYLMYGLQMEGKFGKQLMKSLCGFVHNMARDDGGCGAIVAEVSQRDPVREAIPHWSKLSWAEDMWCIKNLEDMKKEIFHEKCGLSNWLNYRSSSSVIFVDPRDF